MDTNTLLVGSLQIWNRLLCSEVATFKICLAHMPTENVACNVSNAIKYKALCIKSLEEDVV